MELGEWLEAVTQRLEALIAQTEEAAADLAPARESYRFRANRDRNPRPTDHHPYS